MPFDPRSGYRRYHRYFVDVRSLYKKREVIIYTGLTLSFLAIAFFGVFALRPTLMTIASLIREVQDKKMIDQQLQTKINSLTLAQINFASIENSLSLIDEALPTDPFLSQILPYFEFLTQQEELTIRSIALEPVVIKGKIGKEKSKSKKPGPNQAGFIMTLSGNFENLIRFVSSLEKVRRIITIDSATFTQTKTEETQAINLTISGKAYYLTEEGQ